MLCSLSLSTSGQHWLERLHTSSGLPALRPDLPLEHFLATSIPAPIPIARLPSCPLPKHDGFDAVTSALADLFNMSGRGIQDLPRKSLRKQKTPRSYSLPADDGEGRKRKRERNVASLNSVAGARKKRKVREVGEGRAGFSRTDVVVIDTSCGGSSEWKSSKIIFRKGTIWNIRDKKLWNLARRKRRRMLGLAEKEQEDVVGGKARNVDDPAEARGGKINSYKTAFKDPIVTHGKRSSRRPTCKKHYIPSREAASLPCKDSSQPK